MASLFISHSSSDQDAAQRLEERLRAEGFAALFLDFDPEEGIPAGRNWERELYAQLRKTDAVIFLASAASVASRWCFAELSLARSLGRPVSRCGRYRGGRAAGSAPAGGDRLAAGGGVGPDRGQHEGRRVDPRRRRGAARAVRGEGRDLLGLLR